MNTQTESANIPHPHLRRVRRCLHTKMDESSIVGNIKKIILQPFLSESDLQSVYNNCRRNLLGSPHPNLIQVLIDQLLKFNIIKYDKSCISLRKNIIERFVGTIIEKTSIDYTFANGNSTSTTWLKIIQILKQHNIKSNLVYNKACDGINFVLQESPHLIKNVLTRKSYNPTQYEHWCFLMEIISHFEPLQPIQGALTQLRNRNLYINAYKILNKIPKGSLTDATKIQEILLIANIFSKDIQSKKIQSIVLNIISKIKHTSLQDPLINRFIKNNFEGLHPHVMDIIKSQSALEHKKYQEFLSIPISSLTNPKTINILLRYALNTSKKQPTASTRNKVLNLIARIDFKILQNTKVSDYIEKHFQHLNIDIQSFLEQDKSNRFSAIDEPFGDDGNKEHTFSKSALVARVKPKVVRSDSIPTSLQQTKASVEKSENKGLHPKSKNFATQKKLTCSKQEENHTSSQNLSLFPLKRKRTRAEENDKRESSVPQPKKLRALR